MAEKKIKKVSKNTEITKEIKRLTDILVNKDIDDEKLKIAKAMISDIAFMTVEMKELKEQIHKDGCVEEYKNGANQFGKKKSACAEIYLNMSKQHASLMKQIVDFLPADVPKDSNDELDEFLKRR